MKVAIFFILLFVFAVAQDDHDHGHQEEGHLEEAQIWGFGFLASLAVSLIGFIAAIIVVVVKKCCNESCSAILIKFLFSLACGALLGDSFVHILAEAYASQKVEGSLVALTFLCSVLFTLLLEKIFESCGVSHSHWHEEEKKKQMDKNRIDSEGMLNMSEQKKTGKSGVVKNTGTELVENQQEIKSNEEQGKKNCCHQFKNKGTIGYLNLLASLIHNFMDGLAIGVAFATGKSEEFIPVLIAVICHEIPREMGDVAILMKNQFTEKQTILCNGTINLISIVGALIGLGLNSLDEAVKIYLLVFVAGNFVYIAADIWRHLFKNTGEKWKNVLEFFGFALGVGVMFLLLLLEEEEGHSH